MRNISITMLGSLALFFLVGSSFAQDDMTSKNKETARMMVEEVINKGNIDAVSKYFAKDAVNHSAPPGMPQGQEGATALFKMLRGAFPDFNVKIIDEIAEGDKVVHRVITTGTMKGEFMHMAPTGKKASWMEIHILRLKDNKIVEHWGLVDSHAMMMQLGLLPAKEKK